MIIAKNTILKLDNQVHFLEEGNILSESIDGAVTTRGNAPIDHFIEFVDVNYLDWNPANPKFQQAAAKFLVQVPSKPEDWANLINSSSQSPRLKQTLIELTRQMVVPKGWDAVEGGAEEEDPAPKGWDVVGGLPDQPDDPSVPF